MYNKLYKYFPYIKRRMILFWLMFPLAGKCSNRHIKEEAKRLYFQPPT